MRSRRNTGFYVLVIYNLRTERRSTCCYSCMYVCVCVDSVDTRYICKEEAQDRHGFSGAAGCGEVCASIVCACG